MTGTPDSTEIRERLDAGNRAFGRGDWREAAHHYARAVAEDVACAEGWYNLGSARVKGGNLDGAVDAYRRAARLRPDHVRTWHNLSTALLLVGDPKEAAVAASRAVALDAERAKSWNNLGAARFRTGDHAGAEQALRRAIHVDPACRDAWANLGRVYLERGWPEKAADALARSLAGDGADLSGTLDLAKAQDGMGDRAAAEQTLLKALTRHPESQGPWRSLADLYLASERFEEALTASERAGATAFRSDAETRAHILSAGLRAALALALSAGAASRLGDFAKALERGRLLLVELGIGGLPKDAAIRRAIEDVVRGASKEGGLGGEEARRRLVRAFALEPTED